MNTRSIKFWINVITIGALGLLVVFAHDQIAEGFSTIWTLNFLWLLLIIPIQLGNYFSVAKFYQSYLKTMGEFVRFKELYKVGLEMNFVNNVFPSGGLSGFGYIGVRLRKLGVKGSKTALLQTSRHILTFTSFIFYLLFALLLLSLFGNASRLIVMIASGLVSLIIFGTLSLIYVISSEARITQFMAALPKLVNKAAKTFHIRKRLINVARVEELFRDLHKDYVHVRRNWKDLRYPFLWTMAMNFTEILTIFIVYLSFGEIVNPGAIIIAYAVANIAGLVAVLPGGVGVYEGLMTAVMASAGVNKALALSATLVYRIFNMSVFLPIGYYLYHKALKQLDVEAEEIPGMSEEDHV